MVFPSFSENPHVIYETVNIRELGQNDPHQSTKCGSRIYQTEGHGLKLEQASWCLKCCQWFRSFRQTDLPITLTQIHFREKFMS